MPYRAGFRWDNELKVWYTPDYGVAARLSTYLDDSALAEMDRVRIKIKPWVGGLAVPDDQKLYKFQKVACLFALSRNRSYLALDPGLGKTPIAAVTAMTLFNKYPIAGIYICPPFLVRNTQIEFARWAPRLSCGFLPNGFPLITIVPDSMLFKRLPEIKKLVRYIKKLKLNAVLFVDEAHRYKNDQALRTKALFGPKGIAQDFDKVIYLSGTPMPNRPIELYPVLRASAPTTIDFKTKFEYAKEYCAAYRSTNGWDFSGASNVRELAKKVIGTFMLRYKKDDVLKELPPKTEELVILNATLSPKYADITEKVLKRYSPEDLMKQQIKIDLGKEELHLATYRKELGILKAKPVAEYIRFLLDETEENILVFAVHKEVIRYLTNELAVFAPVVITGDTRMELRDPLVKQFQDPRNKLRLFIGNIQAAGVGFTLTRATRVVFAEFMWTPGDNEQASDRAHRIGQKDNVLVQYLVYENSIDRAVIESILRKKKSINALR